MDYQPSRPGEFIIGISNKQYKIVKFINEDNQMKAQKIFQIQLKHPDQLIDLKSQLQNVKDYLMRLNELHSALKIQTSQMQIQQNESATHFIVKVNTPFCQFPTLFDFHKKQIVNPSYVLKYDQIFYIYFFEQFFELILKGGGIKNFFYTNYNIWFMAPNPHSILEMGKLILNKTSITGFKFIKGYESITKQQFIEIYPSLPPNVYDLMRDKTRKGKAKLDLIIKIRSFAFLILTFVIRRVPLLFDQNFKPRIDCQQVQIKKLVEKSAEIFQIFLKLIPIQKEIKAVQKLTNIKLLKFFQSVFVKTSQQDTLTWLWVYRVFFQKNIVNIDSFQRTKEHQKKENQLYIRNQIYFQKIIYQMWQMQTQKNFYIEKGLVETGSLVVNMVYFVVKINGDFHQLLRFLNVVQFMMLHRFSEEASQIALKMMHIFNPKLAPKNEQNIQEIYKIIQQSRSLSLRQLTKIQQKTGNQLTLDQQSDQNIFNPFSFKNQKQKQLASKTYPNTTLNFPSGPIQFLYSVFTHPIKLGQKKGTSQVDITTMSHKLESIINISKSLWFV